MSTNSIRSFSCAMTVSPLILASACASNPDNFTKMEITQSEAVEILVNANSNDPRACKTDSELGFVLTQGLSKAGSRVLVPFEEARYEIQAHTVDLFTIYIQPPSSGISGTVCELPSGSSAYGSYVYSKKDVGRIVSALEKLGVEPNKAPLGYNWLF